MSLSLSQEFIFPVLIIFTLCGLGRPSKVLRWTMLIFYKIFLINGLSGVGSNGGCALLIKRRASCKWKSRVLGGFWCAWSCLAPPAGGPAGLTCQMGPGVAPEAAVAGIRTVGGGLQSQMHPQQYETKQPRCGWEVGMADRGGLAPALGPPNG
jgi:hypothetical protein